MTAELLQILETSQIIIDTCTLMNQQEDFFKETLYDILCNSGTKVVVPEAVNFELKKNRLRSKTKFQAEEGLDILNLYHEADLLVVIDEKKSHADLQIIKLVLDYAVEKPVCVFTEDKKLALDILGYIQHFQSSRLNHPVYCMKLVNGQPQIWNLEELEKKLNLMQDAQYKVLVKNIKHRMILSLVIDNSASIKGNRFSLLTESIQNFHKNLIDTNMVEYVMYEIVLFEGLTPKVVKEYHEDTLDVSKLVAGGVPVLNKSIDLALQNITREAKEVIKQGWMIYKPWLVLLMDGQNFGDMDNIKQKIESSVKNNSLAYFPFLLSSNDVDDSLDDLFRYKRPLQIIQNKYEELFKWIFETIKQRIETPIDQPAQLDFKKFDGWIQK